MPTRSWKRAGLLLLAGGLLSVAGPSMAAAQSEDGFLFRRPRVSLGFNAGYAIPRAGSDVYDDLTRRHTLEDSDFQSPVFMGSLGIRASERFDVSLEVGYAGSRTRSEYRDWVEVVGDETLPIEQTTELERIPITASVRAYLWDRGRRISRFAWVPATWSPYVGLGGGWVHYSFQQEGDFVVEEPGADEGAIFRDRIESDGSGGIFHLSAGAEFSISPRFVLRGETRYSWAEADLDTTFGAYQEPIDLSGLQATVGIAVRF